MAAKDFAAKGEAMSSQMHQVRAFFWFALASS